MAGLKEISERAGVDDTLASRFVEALARALEEGDRVIIRGLGTFKRERVEERTFQTALMVAPVTKPARYKISFKPSDLLLDRLPTPPDR